MITAAPAAFLTARHRGAAVGAGRAAVQGDWVVLTDIAVAESARGRGYGGRIVEALASEGERRGARWAALQVMEDNPATTLYARLGFRQHHRYRYRTAPDQ